MKALILILTKAGVFYSCLCFSQNIIPNGSFETYSSCPNNWGQINNAIGWFSATSGTPDYYNSCNSSLYSVPNNTFGFQYANSGNAYAGVILFQKDGSTLREYIEVLLIDTLQFGKKYCTEFYTSLANSSYWGISDIGVYFSTSIVLDTNNNYGVLAYIPQVKNINSNVITDTLDWAKISGIFIANGGEKYITIGNFDDDTNTNTLPIIVDTTIGFAYYYIDDVSLYEIDENFPANLAGADAEVCPASGGVQIGSPAIPGFKYQWQPATYLSSDTVAQPSLTQLPNNPITLTYILQITNDSVPYSCKPTTTDTVTVTIKPLPVFTITTTKDTVCTGDSVQLTATPQLPTPNSQLYWSTGDTGSTITVFPQTDTLITATATDSGCTYTDSIVIKAVQPPVPTITAGSNPVCSGETATLTGAGGTNYLWSTGETTPSISPTLETTSTFFLTVTNPPCTATDSVSIAVKDCPQPKDNIAFLPTIFSPNGDGNNDYFRVRGENIAEGELSIYNRWGERIYNTQFTKDDLNDVTKWWNGTQSGKPLNTAVFVYYLKVTFEDGEKREMKGNVTLVR